MNNRSENPQPTPEENQSSSEFTPGKRKKVILQLILEKYSDQLDQTSADALERLITNAIEQTSDGMTLGESDEVIADKVKRHPSWFVYELRNLDDEFIMDIVEQIRILWTAPAELLPYIDLI